MARHWLDRLTSSVAPIWTLKRERARRVAELLAQRHYEAASAGRRTEGWHRSSGDANAAIGPNLARLRDAARDLVRNNGYAESAVATIADQTVGTGIVATSVPPSQRWERAWQAWAETTACDADGRHDFYGLQKLVMATVVESGEALVRRRRRRTDDGLPLPLQLQVLEPDHLDTTKTTALREGGEVLQGVEFDALGRRVAYWLFPRHPGAAGHTFGSKLLSPSRRVPASEVLHIFKGRRPGQVRAASWFAPVLLRFKDFDDYEDAQLIKQKTGALLSVITSDTDGSGLAPALGKPVTGTDADGDSQPIDMLEPGAIINVPPGRSIEVVQPPRIGEYADFVEVTLRGIATGLGVTYEDLTGDYTDLPYSAARMSRLRHFARIQDWRWRMLIPQFCDPVWAWATEAGELALGMATSPAPWWTPESLPMIDPDKEGLAVMRNVRTGIQTLQEALRERGFDPTKVLDEIQATNAMLDRRGIVLDSDPRQMSQVGQKHPEPKTAGPTPAAGEEDDAA